MTEYVVSVAGVGAELAANNSKTILRGAWMRVRKFCCWPTARILTCGPENGAGDQ